MKLKQEFTVRALVVYVVALAAAWMLTEVVWGAAGGLAVGLSMARNPEYQQKIKSFMEDKGVGGDSSRADARKAYENLSQEDKQELVTMSQDAIADINWLVVTLFVSAVVFGLVGFLGGLIARAWLLAGAVPALSFLTNNPIIRFSMAKDLSTVQRVIVVVLAQFTICYLLAYCGAKLGLRRKQKKETANQAVEATV